MRYTFEVHKKKLYGWNFEGSKKFLFFYGQLKGALQAYVKVMSGFLIINHKNIAYITVQIAVLENYERSEFGAKVGISFKKYTKSWNNLELALRSNTSENVILASR